MESVELFKRTAPKVSKLSEAEVADTIRDCFKFTVVRDPYSRTLSAFLDKVRRNKKESVYVRDFLGHHTQDSISLSQFLDYLEFGEGWRDDSHWARQTDLMGLPASELDYIGRFETLSEDLQWIMQQIFGDQAVMKKVSPHSTMAKDLVKDQTKANLARIYRIYEADFDILGYANQRLDGRGFSKFQ